MKALALLFIVACGPWQPGDPVHSVGDDAWRSQVEYAAAIWENAVECLEPFPVTSEDGMAITLYSPDNWPHSPGEVGVSSTDDWIDVKGTSDQDLVDVLVHEMGHRLHLGHTSDPTSVMHPIRLGVMIPNATDTRLAKQYACN